MELKFELDILNKIDNKVKLEEDELVKLVFNYDIDRINYNGEYGFIVETIVKLQDRLFMIEWFEGYNDCTDSEFDKQPIEVEMYEEIIRVKKYKEKK